MTTYASNYTERHPYIAGYNKRLVIKHRSHPRTLRIIALALTLLLALQYAVFTEKQGVLDWFNARWQPRLTYVAPARPVFVPEGSALEDTLVSWVRGNAIKPVSVGFAKMVVRKTFDSSLAANVDPFLMLALMKVESGFDYRARSSAGAMGLTQVIPKWHYSKGANPVTIFDPKNNIRIGVEILAEYAKWHKGDMRKALLQYNGSLHIPGAEYSNKVLKTKAMLEKYLEKTQL